MRETLEDLDVWYSDYMKRRHWNMIDKTVICKCSVVSVQSPMVTDDTYKLNKALTQSTSQLAALNACTSSQKDPDLSNNNVNEGKTRRLSEPTFAPFHARPVAFAALLLRRNRLANMKKSEGSKSSAIKTFKKPARSPNLPKKQSSPESASSGNRIRASTLPLPVEESQHFSHSTEDLDSVELNSRDNGSSGEAGFDDIDGHGSTEGHSSEAQRTKAAIDHLQIKIHRTMEQIKTEQTAKEANVNEYLQLANSADKQQVQRIKTVFEKKNQKSTQTIAQLQKKLENYNKRLKDIEIYGFTGHKSGKEVLRDMGQGLKDVGANIVDGITGFSGGVVDNIRGAKDTIVSKPKEFAHLIKNKFGSADNITQMKIEEGQVDETVDNPHGECGTLPASFRYGSDEENSSMTSGSNYGVQSSPQSTSRNASQQMLVIPQISLDPLLQEVAASREANSKLHDTLQRLVDEFESYKCMAQAEFSVLKSLLEDERYHVERLEEQVNDLTELHQNEVTNFKQDISSMEEKIEYRLDERTSDFSDMLENCQTRITKMELQQQQQQIISMEMVDNVTFRTILTKLINVVLAILAVMLVFVSTAANLISPFLHTRARILSTVVLVISIVLAWQNWQHISSVLLQFFQYVEDLLPRQ